jgi:hypothetical protein
MSQRLRIGATEDTLYDCVISSINEPVKEKLLDEWVCRSQGGVYVKPWKIRIDDRSLFRAVEPIIAEVIRELGEEYPESIWRFYEGQRTIEHPSSAELNTWLNDAAG